MPSNITKKRRGIKQPLLSGDRQTRKESVFGDMRLVETNRNVELNIKHNFDWYKTRLYRKDFTPYAFRNHQHHYADNSVTANTYHFTHLTKSETTALSTTLANTDLLMIPSDCEIKNLQFISNRNIAATNTIGFKFYKYNRPGKGVAASDIVTIGNYTVLKEYTSDDAVALGELLNIPLDIKLKAGDIMVLAAKTNATTSFRALWINLVFKEFWKDLR